MDRAGIARQHVAHLMMSLTQVAMAAVYRIAVTLKAIAARAPARMAAVKTLKVTIDSKLFKRVTIIITRDHLLLKGLTAADQVSFSAVRALSITRLVSA